MPLRSWHYGKLIILWSWGLVLCALLAYFVNSVEPTQGDEMLPFLGILAVGLILLIAASLSVVTWKWLSGKEEPGP